MPLYEGKYLRVLKKGPWEYVERTHSNEAVVILAVTDDDRVILTEQFRIPVGAPVIEFPAGLLKDPGSPEGETKEEAAIRELLEETGYQAEAVELLASAPPHSGARLGNRPLLRGLLREKDFAGRRRGLGKDHRSRNPFERGGRLASGDGGEGKAD